MSARRRQEVVSIKLNEDRVGCARCGDAVHKHAPWPRDGACGDDGHVEQTPSYEQGQEVRTLSDAVLAPHLRGHAKQVKPVGKNESESDNTDPKKDVARGPKLGVCARIRNCCRRCCSCCKRKPTLQERLSAIVPEGLEGTDDDVTSAGGSRRGATAKRSHG